MMRSLKVTQMESHTVIVALRADYSCLEFDRFLKVSWPFVVHRVMYNFNFRTHFGRAFCTFFNCCLPPLNCRLSNKGLYFNVQDVFGNYEFSVTSDTIRPQFFPQGWKVNDADYKDELERSLRPWIDSVNKGRPYILSKTLIRPRRSKSR